MSEIRFSARRNCVPVMLSDQTKQYLKDWAEHLNFAKGQSYNVLIENILRLQIERKTFPKLHKSFRILETKK